VNSDVLIVGGGLIGASLAWNLARRGAAVRILEASAWGGEASWAGAGMLAPGGEVDAPGPVASLCLRGRELYPAFAAELTAATGLPIDLRLCGAVETAASGAELEALARRAEAQSALGIPSTPLAPREMAARVPGLDPSRWAGGRFYPCDGMVDPREIMAALRQACLAGGVSIRQHTPAALVQGNSVLTRSGERFHAEAVVLAAGAWSTSIRLDPPRPLPRAYPVRGHLISYRRPPGELAPLLRHGHTYLLQRSNGTLIAGTTQENAGFDRRLDPAAVEDIQLRAAALLPALASAETAERWTGFRPAAEGGAPAMGRIEDSPLWLAYGHFRNGILMAPAVAAELAEAVTATLGKA
jgi:glycine oxidase